MLNYIFIKSSKKKPPSDIAGRKLYAMCDIDDAASQVRSNIVMPMFGQESLYIEKSEEAIDYTTSGYPSDLSNYPLIKAEVNATGITAQAVAESILTKKGEWISSNAVIEEIRLRGKAEIRSEDVNSIGEIDSIKEQTIDLLNNLL